MKRNLFWLLFALILFVLSIISIGYKNAVSKDIVPATDPLFHNDNCIKYCGEGYFYDRPGEKNNGQELVCTKYPLKCGYSCTYGWNIRYLVEGTNYTCQEALQRQKDTSGVPLKEEKSEPVGEQEIISVPIKEEPEIIRKPKIRYHSYNEGE